MSGISPQNMALATSFLCFYSFRLPVPGRLFDLKPCVKNSIVRKEAAEFVNKFQMNRTNMVSALTSTATDIGPKLVAVDDYLPYISKLLKIIINQEVRLDQMMIFEWKGAVSTAEKPNTHQEVIFDLIMTLHTKAILHYNLGKQAAFNTATLPVALQHFANGASIFDYLATTLVPRWVVNVKSPEARSPECQPEFNAAMVHLFKAAYQQVAIGKAITKEGGGTGNALLSKLIIGCTDDYNNWLRFKSSHTQEYMAKIDHELSIFAVFMREILVAGTHLYLGKIAQTNAMPTEANSMQGQCGLAIAYFNAAKTHLLTQKGDKYNANLPGLPQISSKFDYIKPALREFVNVIDADLKESNTENTQIYYQVVPTSLPPQPAAMSLYKATTYAEPPFTQMSDPDAIILEYYIPPKTGIFGSIFSSSSDSKAKPKEEIKAPPAATPVAANTAAEVASSSNDNNGNIGNSSNSSSSSSSSSSNINSFSNGNGSSSNYTIGSSRDGFQPTAPALASAPIFSNQGGNMSGSSMPLPRFEDRLQPNGGFSPQGQYYPPPPQQQQGGYQYHTSPDSSPRYNQQGPVYDGGHVFSQGGYVPNQTYLPPPNQGGGGGAYYPPNSAPMPGSGYYQQGPQQGQQQQQPYYNNNYISGRPPAHDTSKDEEMARQLHAQLNMKP